MSLARPDTDLLDILSATTGSFAVQEESARDDAIRLKTEALERWTTIAGRPQGAARGARASAREAHFAAPTPAQSGGWPTPPARLFLRGRG